MSIVAEFTIEADEFLLGRVIGEFPGLSVDLERVVPVGKRVIPYVWGYGPDLGDFEAAMADHPNVDSITVLDRVDDRALYKVEWEDPANQFVSGIAEVNGTVLEAHGDDEWAFRIRFEDHTDLTAFHDYCQRNDIAYHLNRVYSLVDAPQPDSVDPDSADTLTRPQREALVMAVERGYFEVPRKVTLAELATDLGVSEQAISERVRRGADRVLRKALRVT